MLARLTTRTAAGRAFLALAAALTGLTAGCARRQVVPPPPPIADLYQQAVQKATEYPEANFAPHETLPPVIESVPHGEPTAASKRRRIGEEGALAELLPPGAEPMEEPKLLTLTISDVDIRQAIDDLCAAAQELEPDSPKISCIVDDRAKGIVTAEINDLTFEEALQKVLLPAGLVYAKHGKHYLITSSDPESPMFAQVAQRSEYLPQNHTAKELMDMLTVKHQKYVRVLDKRNVLSIEAPKMLNDQIRTRLFELDIPVPQVVLEALVCVVAPNSNFKFGIDWNQKFATTSTDVFDVGMTSLAGSLKFSPAGAASAFDDFAVTSAFVNLLAQNGYLTIRTAPRLMVKDGEKANLSIARESWFSTQPITNSATAVSGLVIAQNIQKVESGITLTLTPSIRGDSVTCNIEKAEVSEDIRTAESLSNPYPVITRRQVSTTVHVKDGKTIVIGGLVQKQTVNRINEVPYLSDLPLVGKIFQQVEKQEQDVEVVIFISPRIVNSDPNSRVVNGQNSMRR